MGSSANPERPIHVTLSVNQVAALITAANLVISHPEARSYGWDGHQLRTLRAARDNFEQAAIVAFELTDTDHRRKRA